MKLRILSPMHGDQVLELSPAKAAEAILEEVESGRAGFVKFSNGEVFNLMRRSGILEQMPAIRAALETKGAAGESATIIPNISGG